MIAISVIIPVYNSMKYLKECLDSVLKQTMGDIEIICVNDGSTDESLSILESYVKKDSRISIVNQTNGGLGHARNTGFDIARGEYISFVDSDDMVEPTLLEKIYNKAKSTDSDMTLCNCFLYFCDTNQMQVFRDEAFFTFLKNKVFHASDYPEIIGVYAAWDRLYRRDFLVANKIRYQEKVIYEDRLFSIECYVKARRITVVNEPLYFYRKNAGSSITDRESKEDKHKQDFYKMTSSSLMVLKESGLYNKFRRHYLANHFEHALMHQRYCRNYEVFEKFFRGIHSLMEPEDACVYGYISNSDVCRYVDFLLKNDVKGCYRYLRD